MAILLAFLGGLSTLCILAGLTAPKSTARARTVERPEQFRLRAFQGRGKGLVAGLFEELAAWFQGEGLEDRSWRAGLNTRYEQLLKQADWYWGPGEPAPPSRDDAPFWNLETMWSAKVLHAVLFTFGGVVLAGAAAIVFHASPALALLGLLVGIVGFVDPDAELSAAAERRRRQIVLEMGYKTPELRVVIQSGRTLPAALRELTDRPGGPFVQEMYRVVQVYNVTTDVERGLEAAIRRNRLCEPLVSLCADVMAVMAEGGELGQALETHAESAQHEQRRLLRQQAQDNTQEMSYVVAGTTLIVIFLLIAGPALWTVVTSLGAL